MRLVGYGVYRSGRERTPAYPPICRRERLRLGSKSLLTRGFARALERSEMGPSQREM